MNLEEIIVIIKPANIIANEGILGIKNLHAKGTTKPNINNIGYLIPNCINTAPNIAGTA